MNLFIFLKERLQIADVVKEYVALKKAGIYYKGPCPFHHEKDASFTVSPHKGIFYCFGCHASGDVIGFIAQIEGCNQLEAAKLLLDKYNIEVPPQLLIASTELAPDIEQKNRYYQLCQTVAQWLTHELSVDADARAYITTRKVSFVIQNQFEIGYFPAGQLKSLQRFVQKNGFLVKDLIENHIVIDGPSGMYSPFEQRIMFPIYDHLGRCCGFGGRVFKPDDERAKYYNSRENTFFNKGKILFGLHHAKREMQRKKEAFLVEGYFDCVAMVQHGHPNTVATLGTACSAEHLKMIAHYAETLYVIFDGDNAGLQAMLRLTQLCWHVNINIRIICLPKNEDPASFLSAGNDVAPYVAQARDIFDFFIVHAGDTFKNESLKGKMAVVCELLEIIDTIDDKLKQTILLKTAADKLGVPYDVLVRERTLRTKVSKKEPVVVPVREQALHVVQEQFFALLVACPALIDREDSAWIMQLLPEQLQRILRAWVQLSQPTVAALTSVLSDEDKQITCALLVAHDGIEREDHELIITRAMHFYWKSLNQKIKEKIIQASQQNNQHEVSHLLEYLQELKKKMITRSLL